MLAGIADAFSGAIWIGENVEKLVEAVNSGAPVGWRIGETVLNLGMIGVVYYVIGAALFLLRRNDAGDITFPLLIAAFVPPGCFIGFPASVCALVLLSKPEVKALFPTVAKPADGDEKSP